MRPGAGRGVAARAGVRWDRVGRIAMAIVLTVLAYLYLSAGIRLFSTWRQASEDGRAVAAMEHEHRVLVREHEVLGGQSTVEAQARRLGMIDKGEQQYIVTGLPAN